MPTLVYVLTLLIKLKKMKGEENQIKENYIKEN